jgi:hypothetical protein
MRSSMFVAVLGAFVFVTSAAAADVAPPPADGAPPPALPAPDATAPPPAAADAATRPRPQDEDERTARNAVYVEGLGPGLLYSINYERSFGDFAARIGFSYWSVSANSKDGTSTAQETASLFTVPITLSYLGIGSARNMFEVGAGATIVHVGAGGSVIDTDSSTTSSGSATLILPHAVLGYRYMAPDGGFLLKAGIAPIFAGDSIPVLPWPYLALGGVF